MHSYIAPSLRAESAVGLVQSVGRSAGTLTSSRVASLAEMQTECDICLAHVTSVMHNAKPLAPGLGYIHTDALCRSASP